MKLMPDEFGSISAQDRANIKQKMPIPELGLDLSDELTIVKAKMRPAVLIHHRCPNWRDEARRVADRAAGKSKPERHLFAPIYSLTKDDGSTDYPSEFVDLVKKNEFPSILFLPAYSIELRYDSMLVLSDAFMTGVHTLRPTDICVDPLTLGSKIEEWVEFLTTEALNLDGELSSPSTA